jgi:prepilin-type N-terminal cleavage/methylation domain-containing protein
MSRKPSGFTLVELLITILMTGLILAAASSSFVSILSLSRTQGRIAESNQSMVGLELLRRDIESAGTGLFWDDPSPLAYTAEPNSTIISVALAAVFNEKPIGAPTGAPRALILRSNDTVFTDPTDNTLFGGSSYLVIKSMNVAGNSAGDKWSYVQPGGAAIQWNAPTPLDNENLKTNDNVIVLNPRDKTSRPLIVNSATGKWFTKYQVGAGSDSLLDSAFAPLAVALGGNPYDTYIVSGITGSNDLTPVRPFNRADYFISRSQPDGVPVPTRCAPNTGVLFKAVMTHGGATAFTYQPLLDCVADMRVFFGVDSDNDGIFKSPLYGGTDAYLSSIPTTSTAQEIRTQVKEVRVYILTHEGRMDTKFTYPSANITVGETFVGSNLYALGANTHYRWKVYRLIAQPQNLLK